MGLSSFGGTEQKNLTGKCAERWNIAHPGELRFVSDARKCGTRDDHA
ncbi:hypothetical protein ACFPFX_04760 [Streptomyces mauvecolor]|uniref:Uncharacterized protein n=1 Tax=Streptomyces mauvecolor TaxID=58345 RepID=A0ABV9UIM1_9ACTN